MPSYQALGARVHYNNRSLEDRQESVKDLLPSGIDSGYHCAIKAVSARCESDFPGPEFLLCPPFIVKALELGLSSGNFLINFLEFLLKALDFFGYFIGFLWLFRFVFSSTPVTPRKGPTECYHRPR